jgi:hypothetical protein
VSVCGGSKVLSLLEEIEGMRLELRLSRYYRTCWQGAERGPNEPRYRSSSGYEAKFYGEKG